MPFSSSSSSLLPSRSSVTPPRRIPPSSALMRRRSSLSKTTAPLRRSKMSSPVVRAKNGDDFSESLSTSSTPSTSTSTSTTPPTTTTDPFATKETYDDGPFARFMISYFSKKMAAQLGVSDKPRRPGYDGFVDLSKEIVRGRTSEEQRKTVADVLASLLPPGGPERFRMLFPFSRWSAEANAMFTMIGFGWLVGPMSVVEVDVTLPDDWKSRSGREGDRPGDVQRWRSGVKIEKCRYLQESGCVGLCTNLCKRPTEAFFADAFGLPLTMEPDFETLECTMRFGQSPPPIEQDAVYNQPCFAGACSMASPSGPCPKIDTDRAAKAVAAAAAVGGGGGGGDGGGGA